MSTSFLTVTSMHPITGVTLHMTHGCHIAYDTRMSHYIWHTDVTLHMTHGCHIAYDTRMSHYIWHTDVTLHMTHGCHITYDIILWLSRITNVALITCDQCYYHRPCDFTQTRAYICILNTDKKLYILHSISRLLWSWKENSVWKGYSPEITSIAETITRCR